MASLQHGIVGKGICGRELVRVSCHLSSVHTADDIRIYHKECVALKEAGWKVHIVANAPNFAIEDPAIKIHAFYRKSSARLYRIIVITWLVYQTAKKINADVYHLHDPELLLYGVLLSLSGKNVIYDAHEDLPKSVLSKSWLPFIFRGLIKWAINIFELACAKIIKHVVAATLPIGKRFKEVGCDVAIVRNYPDVTGAEVYEDNWRDKENAICYVGSITETRGVIEIIEAADKINCKLYLAGSIRPDNLFDKIKERTLKGNIEYCGYLDRAGINILYKKCKAGLVILHPTQSYVESLPIKLFEYMSAGLPVIASNFPEWINIINNKKCGICVDPLDIDGIADAIKKIIEDACESKAMGRRGLDSVLEEYNWRKEKVNLLGMYKNLI